MALDTNRLDTPPPARPGGTERGRDRDHSRIAPRIRRGQPAPQQEAHRPRGQGRRQPVLRALHAHAHQLRPRRPPARRRHARLLRQRLQPAARARRSSTRPRTSRRWASTSSSSATPSPGAPHLLAQHLGCRVINAGDGAHEHPTQGLLDIFTIRQRKGRIEGLTVGLVGDIAHSRVARSNIHGLTKLGAKVIVCGPPTLVPRDDRASSASRSSHHLDDDPAALRRAQHAAHPVRAAAAAACSRRSTNTPACSA